MSGTSRGAYGLWQHKDNINRKGENTIAETKVLCVYMRFEAIDVEEMKRIVDHHLEYIIDFDNSTDLIKSVSGAKSYTDDEHDEKLRVLRQVIDDIRLNEPDDDDLDTIQEGHELTDLYAEIANLDQALKDAGF